MNKYLLGTFIVFLVRIRYRHATECGCKTLRPCYKDMLETLRDRDEENCVEDASIGCSTVMIFLKAVKQFCPTVITIYEESLTYEGRHLYEVILNVKDKDEKKEGEKGVIVIEAGQQASTEAVGFALFIIEQLVGCEENNEMMHKIKWVILPSTNPDGMEYCRFNRIAWNKNVKPSTDGFSFGVDISRNFDYQWSSCDTVDSGFSPYFPGLTAGSENETIFIKAALNRYLKEIRLYVSIRCNGHSFLYPYAYSSNNIANGEHVIKFAADVAAKVNQRGGGIQIFMNESIYEANGKPHCGHSVDMAYDLGIPLAYEMRVFLGAENQIMTKFQQLPRGFESTLRQAYFSGVREMFNLIINDKKYKKRF